MCATRLCDSVVSMQHRDHKSEASHASVHEHYTPDDCVSRRAAPPSCPPPAPVVVAPHGQHPPPQRLHRVVVGSAGGAPHERPASRASSGERVGEPVGQVFQALQAPCCTRLDPLDQCCTTLGYRAANPSPPCPHNPAHTPVPALDAALQPPQLLRPYVIQDGHQLVQVRARYAHAEVLVGQNVVEGLRASKRSAQAPHGHCTITGRGDGGAGAPFKQDDLWHEMPLTWAWLHACTSQPLGSPAAPGRRIEATLPSRPQAVRRQTW